MSRNLLIVFLFEFLAHLSLAEESYLMMDTPNGPLSEFCSKALYMNKIGRSLLCHFLPSLNFPFSWGRRNYKAIKSSQLDAINSQAIMNELAKYKYNRDFNSHVIEPQQDYSIPTRYHIPPTFSFEQQNRFPPKLLNEDSSKEFESKVPSFVSNGQMIKPVLSDYETNITPPNMPIDINQNYMNPPQDLSLASSMHINKEKSYLTRPLNSMPSINYEPLTTKDHRWPTDKNIFTNNRDESMSLKSGKDLNVRQFRSKGEKNVAVDSRDGWTPISFEKISNPNHMTERYTPKTPKFSESKQITFSSRIYHSTRAPTSIKKDYSFDISNNEALITDFHNNKFNAKPAKNPKLQTRQPVKKKDLSTYTTQKYELLNSSFEETTPSSIPETEIIVKKEHTDYTKSSIIYSIDGSAQEKTKTFGEQNNNSSIEPENKFNDYIYLEEDSEQNSGPEEVYQITEDTKNNSIRGQPWIDYPMYSSLTVSNFSCIDSGFYADKNFGCQVYHHCVGEDYHQKFICPNGTLFNERIEACDYWFNVKCEKVTKSMKISLSVDRKDDDFHISRNTFEPSYQMSLTKHIHVERNQTINKLIESLKNFVANALNQTYSESQLENLTNISNKH